MSEYGNVIHQEFGGEAAQARVIGNDLDPEKAQRAVDLGEATGIEPNVVAQNLDEFDQYHKASLGAHIVRNNQALKQYIDLHPMAAAVSGDDLGQLDKISDHIKGLNEEDEFTKFGPTGDMQRVFWQGYGEGPIIGGWVMNNPNNFNEDGTLKYFYATAIMSGIGAFLEVPMRAFGGALAVGGAAIEGIYSDVTGDEAGGRRLARELPQLFESYMGTHMGRTLNARQFNQGIQKEIQKVALDNRVQMYWQAGKEIPVGLSKETDAAIERVSKEYWKKIDDLAAEADKSATKERNPDYFRSFIEQHPELEGAYIRVDAEAIKRLYGEDIPSTNDGLLGFIPNLDRALKAGDEFGVSVRVPLTDWITKIDKDLREELKEDARIKTQSITPKEAEDLKIWNKLDAWLREDDEPKAKVSKPTDAVEPVDPEAEAIRTVRQTSGLEPQAKILAQIGDEHKYGASKLKLARLDESARKDLDINLGSKNAFDITDEKGNIVGTLQGQLNGTEYFVDWVSSRAWAQSFGPKQVLQLVKELKAEYPDIKTIVGDRVSGARSGTEKQGERVTFRAQIADDGIIDIQEDTAKRVSSNLKVGTARWDKVHPDYDLEALVKPRKFWTENETKLRLAVEKTLDKLLPEGTYKTGGAQALRIGEVDANGMYVQIPGEMPLILYALEDGHNKIQTVGHEAMHYLRRKNLINDKEWEVLSKAAVDSGWLETYRIEERYPDVSPEGKLEEAIAEKLGELVRDKTGIEGAPFGDTVLKIIEFLRELRTQLKEIFGRELTADDILERASSGKTGRRSLQPEKPVYTFEPAAQAKQLDLSGLTRTEDQQVFEKASAAGLPVKQYKKLIQAIEDVRETDRKYQLDKAEAYERKKQTKEWKTEAEALEPKVREELNTLPDYRANEFFRTGILDGEKLSKLPKLNPEFLEVDSGIPEKYLSDKGMHPDDVAGLLNIDTGNALIGMLASWEEAKGNVAPQKFINDIVKTEVERRMSVKHGPLSENIIDAARDHVINNAQYELIHQDLLAAALRAGKTELPISKKDMEAYAKDEFLRAPSGNVSTEEILREMGKAQRLATLALLDGDPVASLKYMERRMMSFIAAREAKKFDKVRDKFWDTAKRYSDREVKGIEQNYLNFIHDIYMKLGEVKLKFTREDWAKRINEGSHRNLEDFVVDKMNDLLEIKADDRLLDDTLRDNQAKPPIDDLTVEQFQAAHDFIQSMLKNGREEARGDKAFDNAIFENDKKDMLNQLSALDPLEFIDAKGNRKMLKVIPGGPAHVIRTAVAAHWQMEAIFNRIDKGDAFGPFTQKIIRPLVEGANYVSSLERKYSKKLEEVVYKGNMNEKISNSIFKEPSALAEPNRTAWMTMTRENLLKVLMYWGSETGREKLSRGYNIHPDTIQRWIDSNATKEDYEYVESMGKVFRDLKEEIDIMYTNVAGVSPENVKLSQMITPFGQKFDGWYTPLVPHPNAEMTKFGGAGFSGLVQRGFFRSTTANGHTMRRTSAVYPLDLGIDSNISVMKRQIYDLAMRPGLIEASRYLRDPEIRSMITSRLGREITNLIDPYIKDVANAADHNDGGLAQLKQALTIVRSNVIGTLIGWNPGTVMKHGPTALVQSVGEVGAKRFSEASMKLWMMNDDIGKMNWDFAMETSEELQRRHQHYFETLRGQSASMLGKGTKREFMARAGAWPVAMSDLVSAVPLWNARFEQAIKEEGHSHGDAVYLADRAVRRAHGSTAVTNRPRVMRSEAMAFFNPLYGFFNHILNRKYEMGWQTKDKVQDLTRGKITPTEFLKFAPHLAAMLTAYVVAPTLIEELVSPLPSKPDESWGKKAGKAILFTQGSDWLIARDVAHFAVGGFNPSVGLFGPMGQAAKDTIGDLSDIEKATSEEHMGRTLKHTITTVGMTTGLTNAQMGRWAELAYNHSIEKDLPDGWWQWLGALRYGTTKGHSKTPEEYVEHLTGVH